MNGGMTEQSLTLARSLSLSNQNRNSHEEALFTDVRQKNIELV